MKPRLSYDLRPCPISVVETLCARYHGYGAASNTATYAFAVYEGYRVVAAYAWQPPPVGAAKNICPEAPQGVLALSRMVACPKTERKLNHVSKPLRRQMERLIDRGRWPVLVTYSDEGQGHDGHVYKCSGWEKTLRTEAVYYEDDQGRRRSSYSNGKNVGKKWPKRGKTWIQRWEQWVCERGMAAKAMLAAGWRREPIPGKVWRSGNQAYRYVKSAA